MAASGGGPATPDLTPVEAMIGDIISTESVEGVVPAEEGDSNMAPIETQTTNEPGESVSIILVTMAVHRARINSNEYTMPTRKCSQLKT